MFIADKLSNVPGEISANLEKTKHKHGAPLARRLSIQFPRSSSFLDKRIGRSSKRYKCRNVSSTSKDLKEYNDIGRASYHGCDDVKLHSVVVGVFGGVLEGTKFDARYEIRKKITI